jgi:hypothetical protein
LALETLRIRMHLDDLDFHRGVPCRRIARRIERAALDS